MVQQGKVVFGRPSPGTPIKYKALQLWPTGLREVGIHHQWLYAIGFEGGAVKVGRTAFPRMRARTHLRQSAQQASWMHLFGLMTTPLAIRAESLVCRDLSLTWPVLYTRNEWWRGPSRSDVISAVRDAVEVVSGVTQATYSFERNER